MKLFHARQAANPMHSTALFIRRQILQIPLSRLDRRVAQNLLQIVYRPLAQSEIIDGEKMAQICDARLVRTYSGFASNVRAGVIGCAFA